MRIFNHKDYQQYYDAQVEKYERKKDHVWVKPSELIMVVNHIKKYLVNVNYGICHGTRSGWEIQEFKKRLNCNVIGTEIAPNDTEDTIEWDFHNIKDEWIKKFDFIYTNSFDHSNDPEHCIDQWMKCLRDGGICYITWSQTSSIFKRIGAADCLAASKKEYRKMFNEKYVVFDEFYMRKGRLIMAIKRKENKMNSVHESFKHGKNLEMGHFNVIEEDVIVGDNVDIQSYVLLKKGTRIGDNCYVDSYFRSSGDNYIGNNIILRFGATIARKVAVGNDVFISPNVMTVYSLPDGSTSSETLIGDGSFIGTAAVLAPNIKIVPGCVIGANSFVNKSCLQKGVYVGNPAKLIREL